MLMEGNSEIYNVMNIARRDIYHRAKRID